MGKMNVFGVEKRRLSSQWVGGSSLHCCVPRCTCSPRNNSCRVSFHCFPVDNAARQRWLDQIRRDNFTPSRNTRVCSRHFLRSDIVLSLRGKRLLRRGAVPVLFEWNNYSLPEPEPGVCERSPRQEMSHEAAADPPEDRSDRDVMEWRRLEAALSQKEQQLKQIRHYTSLEQTKEPEGSLNCLQQENAGETQQQMPSFKQYSKEKRKHKPRGKRVQVNIGLMLPYNGKLKPQRGRTFSLVTELDVKAADLLKQAVQKMKIITKNVDEGPYVLLYPDRSEVVHVPGTDRPFKLAAYKQLVKKAYQRITFFICQEAHYRRDDDDDDDASDTDSEVGITANQVTTVIIRSAPQGPASCVSRSIHGAPPTTTTSQAGNETTRLCYQTKMISSVPRGSASSVSRSIHVTPPTTTTTTSQAGNETTRPCHQPKVISSVLPGSASRVSRSIRVAPPTTTSPAEKETTRPCSQPKFRHVSCQTEPVQVFPYDAKVVVLDKDFTAQVADLQDTIHDHNYLSSDPSTQLTPSFSQGIKSEPPTFGQEIKAEPPTFGQEIKAEPPTFGLEVTLDPQTLSQEIKSEPPTFGVEVTSEPPTSSQAIQSEPTFSQEMKSEPPPFGLEIKSDPATSSLEIKSKPPPFGLEVLSQPPTSSLEIKSEPPMFGLEIKSEPPMFGLEIKSEPLTHPISSPISHSFPAEHAHSPPQEIKPEPSSDAAASTSHNVLLHMNDTNYVVDACLTQLNLTTCKECNSRVNGITKVVEGCDVIYKVQYWCRHPELSWSAHPLLGDVKSEL